MSKTSVNLTTKQLHILKLTYKFRFVTAGLLAEYRGVLKWSIQNALNTLSNNGYIARRYEKHYKIDRRPAYYYLTPKAINLLKSDPDIDEAMLHARYKDKHLSQTFVDHNLNLFKLCNQVKHSYPDTFSIFTKTELAKIEFFEDLVPDLFIKRIKDSQDLANQYMLEVFSEHTMSFLIKKRIRRYLQHYEDVGNTDEYPTVILVVSSTYLIDSLSNYIAKQKEDLYIDDGELHIVVLAELSAINL